MPADVYQLFQGSRKPIIGMIHLAGNDDLEKIRRGISEVISYNELGLDGVIVEDYARQSSDKHIIEVLKESQKLGLRIVRGVNLLSDQYRAMDIAANFGARFVQFDNLESHVLNKELYNKLRQQFPNVSVLGGVRFKYQGPSPNTLEFDIRDVSSRCEVIVTTGDGTGIETPIEKLRKFKSIAGEYPIFVGAGVNIHNVVPQLAVADGAIVGTYFKKNSDTDDVLDLYRIREFMQVINQNFRK